MCTQKLCTLESKALWLTLVQLRVVSCVQALTVSVLMCSYVKERNKVVLLVNFRVCLLIQWCVGFTGKIINMFLIATCVTHTLIYRMV